jgi:hypothetical protein
MRPETSRRAHTRVHLGMSAVRRRWPGTRTSIGIAAGVAAFAATAVLALTQNGGAGSERVPLAALSTLAHLRPIEAVGSLGPEDVPVPDAPVLARPLRLSADQRIDGITCQTREQVLFHIHAHLTIFVHGAARRVPAGIGIAPPYEVEETSAGPVVAGAACFMWLHTHSADGVIHTESPIRRTYTLGDFFDIWGQRLDQRHVGPAHGPVTALFNGRVFTGNPRRIPLLAHAQIQLEVGNPLIAPETISFPNGL